MREIGEIYAILIIPATLKKQQIFQPIVLHTGQHYDLSLSGDFLKQLGIGKPDMTLDISKHKDRHIKIGQMVKEIMQFLAKSNIDIVIVVGDVDSTLAGSLAASKLKLPLIHIEAGLRSFDLRMPEETNRFIVDQLSVLHFTTDPAAKKNLLNEGYKNNSIKHVGNLMIENLIKNKDKINSSLVMEKFKLKPKTYVVVTIHRFENVTSKSNLTKTLRLLDKLSKNYLLVFPIHPHTLKQIKLFNLSNYLESFVVTAPLGYFDFLKMVSESLGVITDSGGIQEETTFLGIPCCTLRDNTERPITIHLGSNKLFPLDATSASITEHLQRQFKPGQIRYWDDKVSQRIITIIKKRYRLL